MVPRPTSTTSLPVNGGPTLSVRWRTPGSKTWHQYEDSVARAILGACLSEKAPTKEVVAPRRSPRLKEKESRPRKSNRRPANTSNAVPTRTSARLKKEEDVVTSAMSGREIRWGFSPTCAFARLPQTRDQLGSVIAKCKAAHKRQAVSSLLDFLISDACVNRFLADVSTRPDFHLYNPTYFKNPRLCKDGTNPEARPLGALYERFLGAMEGQVAYMSDVLQAFMGGRDTQPIAPFAFAFHGTLPGNIPSILKDGMLPQFRRYGGDWFATSPWVSAGYTRTTLLEPSYRLILFLLLPVPTALSYPWAGESTGVIVMQDQSYELPLCTVDLVYEVPPVQKGSLL